MTKIPDDMSELVNADIPRVDLVGKAANGTKFFLMKGAEETSNMFSPDTVRELLKEADTDVTRPLVEAEGDAMAATVPGSPEWEAVDAASAQKWIGILARAKNAVEVLSVRESVEGDTGNTDGFENSWDLQGACLAIDSAISILAGYAAGEAAEVMLAEDAAEITKAAAAISAGDLETVEAIAAITKAGRALSATNEAALRNAAEAIQKVLASLPPAPEEAPLILKEASVAENPADRIASIEAQMGITPTEVTKTEEAPAETAAIAPAEPVTKADNLLAVYDNKGNLIGVVDPGSVTLVDGGEAVEEEAPAEESAPETDEASPVAAEADPAADEALIPGTNTIQSPVEDDPENVTKAATDIAALLKEALEPLTKQLAAQADLVGQVQVLKDQVEAYGREPDDRKSPYLNGATGTAGIAKRDGTETDPHTELRKAAEAANTQDERIVAQKSLAMAALKDAINPDSRYAETLNRFAS
ncbi:hypothetical protein [Arthrobacter bambusae]|uniref:hypothetical protein n=1 Tax=Arthrobacter bambusae TaxID=1338426 RepID=UPI0027869CBB|nr:hypothetical protein [Arthrobacter bambusae]MDQ0241169.1 hypothetical protein [Arthrobacter bambusae]